MKALSVPERLVVSADFKYEATSGIKRGNVYLQVLKLAASLKGTGVYLKVNSALRICGYRLMDDIKHQDLKVFADLKLFDIGETLVTDIQHLNDHKPDILTVSCGVGRPILSLLKGAIDPQTELLGVTVLSSMSEVTCKELNFGRNIEDTILKLGYQAASIPLGGLICSPKEVHLFRPKFEFHKMTLNTPGIRPTGVIIKGDDQNPHRVMTPAGAIKVGADRIIVGRPITQSQNPYDAVMRILEEIELGLKAREQV